MYIYKNRKTGQTYQYEKNEKEIRRRLHCFLVYNGVWHRRAKWNEECRKAKEIFHAFLAIA